MGALLCLAITAALIGAAWYLAKSVANIGEDTSCDDPYLDSFVREVWTGHRKGEGGVTGRGGIPSNGISEHGERL